MTRFFVAKAWLGGTGVGIGVVGIVLEQRLLIWVAVALLAVAVVLRLAERVYE